MSIVRLSLQHVMLVICLGSCLLFGGPVLSDELPDKASPFTAVRWQQDVPFVRFKGEWYRFESLDGLSRQQILDFAKAEHGRRWQKRFSEDLVEVLQGMGHQPEVSVSLVLSKDGQSASYQGRMTKDNRRAVWRYNKGEDDEPSVADSAQPAPAMAQAGLGHQDVAEAFSRWIDQVWDKAPAEGANLRFLFTRQGKPVAGVARMKTDYRFSAMRIGRGQQITQGFNPNPNGRWVYEGLEPGRYTITLQRTVPGSDWRWQREIEVKEGDHPRFDVPLP